MPNRNYQQGYRYEVKEVDYWTDRGYYSFRSYASKGDFDVIAFNEKEVVVVSVKSFQKKRGSYTKDNARLSRIPKSPGLRRLRAEYGPIQRGLPTPRKETEI